MNEIRMSLSFPLDAHGFLRRACPVCSREFKWLSGETDAETPSSEHYFCPYCGISAEASEWFTREQQAYINTAMFEEVIGSTLQDMVESVQQLNQSSGGLIEISASVEYPERRQAPPVFEPHDMKKVVIACHADNPVKVDETWSQPVHCLRCGEVSDAAP